MIVTWLDEPPDEIRRTAEWYARLMSRCSSCAGPCHPGTRPDSGGQMVCSAACAERMKTGRQAVIRWVTVKQ